LNGRRILWIDDEIDLLESHILFLKEKGYVVRGVSSGNEAIEVLGRERFDVILVDETMPGKSGLETLQDIKEIDSTLPLIMITKNEAEDLMEQAIGMKIDDYLLKPVNPLQIISAIKRLLESHKIQEGTINRDYLRAFRRIDGALMKGPGWDEWVGIHQELSFWDLEFDRFNETGLNQTQTDLKRKCNSDFGSYIEANYRDWIHSEKRPVLSIDIFNKHVFPHLYAKKKVYFIVIDCMRYDQWLKIEDLIAPYFNVEKNHYCAILPTATPYARNALFSGLFPAEIFERYPKRWLERSKEEMGKNRFEREFMLEQLRRAGLDSITSKYVKIYESDEANEIKNQVDSYRSIGMVAMVFNFLDILSHGRSQSEILQEIAPDESAFRSLMRTWFSHSALFEILQKISRHDSVVVITTDHGAILSKRASLIHGNRDTSTNIRYKFGENLNSDKKQTFFIRHPKQFNLPAENPSKNYVLAKEDYYFVYPTKYHKYEKQYQGTFQHGGISLEEMVVPCITLTPK